MKRSLVASLVGLAALVALASACNSGSSGPIPGAKSASDVQSAGMAQSFAGKNKCNPRSVDRPFVIEWDATDMSSFESRAANDVIFVKYEGCDLKIVDACVHDSERGSFGSYRPVEWTSGSVESLDVNNEGDLYAKLPLGAATLGGRVEGGEKFHMEYFVSGTRSATRESVHRGDLAKVSACGVAFGEQDRARPHSGERQCRCRDTWRSLVGRDRDQRHDHPDLVPGVSAMATSPAEA